MPFKTKEQKQEYDRVRRQTYKLTYEYKKSTAIYKWKSRGVINEDFNKLYDTYINTTNCNICNKLFTDSYYRCLDHNHTTGEYRQILCRTCNNWDSWKKLVSD